MSEAVSEEKKAPEASKAEAESSDRLDRWETALAEYPASTRGIGLMRIGLMIERHSARWRQ